MSVLRHITPVTDDDPDVQDYRNYMEDLNDGRLDMLDPMAIAELAEELGVSVAHFIHIHITR